MCAGNGDASWDGGGGGPSDNPGSGTPPFGASTSSPPLCNQEPPFLNKAFRRRAISDDASIVRLKDVASRLRPGSRASPRPCSPNINARRPWARRRAPRSARCRATATARPSAGRLGFWVLWASSFCGLGWRLREAGSQDSMVLVVNGGSPPARFRPPSCHHLAALS